jgi:hypothetical protein
MSFSTKAAPQYFRANFMSEVTYTIFDATTGEPQSFTELDPLSQNLNDLVDSLQRFTMIRWTGQQLTTLVYRVYGNTSLIWLVLMCNGMISRTELRMGMVLRFPLLADIQSAINQITNTNNSQNTVVLI